MADEDRSIRVRFIAEYQSYVEGLRRAGAATTEFGREVSGRGKAVTADVERVGRSALLMAGGMAAGLGLSVKAAVDWESAWAGVTKTVDGTAQQMADLEDGLRNLAKELPSTHGEIAAVAEAAGALGIQRSAIEGFTRTMIDLGETTNVTADEAATSMAQIANIMQTPQTEFDRLGAVLVDLGNNGASTEKEILELANRLAAAGKIAGLSEADVFAFASTLASVGVEAEAGGTAVSKVFIRIRDAVIDGGDNLDTFAKIAGVTSERFAANFREDAAGAVEDFISGLGRMNDAGQSTSGVFKDLELNDERLKRSLLSTAGAGELLTEQLELGRRAWEENTALQTEAEKRYETTAAQLGMLRNQIVDTGIDIGQVMLPPLREAIELVSNLFTGFDAMGGGAKTAATLIGVLSTGLIGVVGVAGTLGPKIKAAQDALANMGTTAQFIGRNMGKLTAGLGLAGVALAVYTNYLGAQANAQQEAEDRVRSLTDAIREQGEEVGMASLEVVAQAILDGKVGEALRSAEADIATLTLGVSEFRGELGRIDESHFLGLVEIEGQAGAMAATMERAGLSGTALAEELIRLAASGEVADGVLWQLLERLQEQGTAYEGAILNADNLAAAEDDAASASRRHASDAEKVKIAAEEEAKANEALIASIEQVMDARRAAVDPLFALLDALDANREAVGAEAEAVAEGAARIADARKVVTDAEKDLAEARAQEGDNASAIAAATERLADANERLAEAEADAVITAEQRAQFSRDAAKSARDVETAAIDLAAAIETGSVSLETANHMLSVWRDQGLLTEEQAANVAYQFAAVAEEADRLGGDIVMSVSAPGLDVVLKSVKELAEIFGSWGVAAQVKAVQTGDRLVRHRGGVVDGSGPYATRPPSPDDVPAWLQPGEGVLNRQAMAILGEAGLDALNAGRMFHQGAPSGPSPAAAGASSSVQYHQQTDSSFHAPITVIGEASRRQMDDVVFQMRRLQLEVTAR